MIVAGVIPIWAIANKPEKKRDFNRICIHGLCVNAAVLHHLRYGQRYIGSRLTCWVHLNQWKEWYMKSNTKKYDHVTPVLAEPKVATSKNQFILQRSCYGI